MTVYAGAFTVILDKLETSLSTAFPDHEVYQTSKLLKAGYKFPSISIQWDDTTKDPGNRDGWLLFVNIFQTKNAPEDDLDVIYDETEAFADAVWTIIKDLNNDDIDAWGHLIKIKPGQISHPKKGFLQGTMVRAQFWVGTNEAGA